MSESEDKRTWVWWSDEDSVRDGTVSVLAIAETIAATALGIWLWFHIGLYPLLLTSAVMAFLTMLRSEASVELGVRWFTAYEEQFENPTMQRPLIILSALLSFCVAGLLSYWVSSLWLTDYSGWSLVWRSGLLGIFTANVGPLLVSAVAALGKGLATAAITTAVTGTVAAVVVASALLGPTAGAATTFGAATTIAVGIASGPPIVNFLAAILASLGFGCGIYVRAILTRMIAVLLHLPAGFTDLPANWTILVTALDLRSRPNLVPGLPSVSNFQVSKVIINSQIRSTLSVRILGSVFIIMFFGPTYIFRFTLKSTFLLYWPLLFIASAPNAYRTEDGSLVWDDARGRRLIDWISAFIAVLALIGIGWSVYDHGVYARLIEWADARDLPAHALMRVIAFDVWRLGPWEWAALATSTITLIVFFWTNAINVRQERRDRQPGWGTLKIIYALGRLKVLLVAVTILTLLFTMTWYVHDTCTLPDFITGWLTHAFGPPQSCIGVPGPFSGDG